MIANSEDKATLARTIGRLTMAVMLAAAAGIMLGAADPAGAGASRRRDRQGDAVLIEATEPVAYSVSRPDPQTLVVDMRNVSVSDARNDVARQGAIAGVRVEQATAVDGRAVARVHVDLARPRIRVRSARNTIRVEAEGRQSPGAGAASAAVRSRADRVRDSSPASSATPPRAGRDRAAPLEPQPRKRRRRRRGEPAINESGAQLGDHPRARCSRSKSQMRRR